MYCDLMLYFMLRCIWFSLEFFVVLIMLFCVVVGLIGGCLGCGDCGVVVFVCYFVGFDFVLVYCLMVAGGVFC